MSTRLEVAIGMAISSETIAISGWLPGRHGLELRHPRPDLFLEQPQLIGVTQLHRHRRPPRLRANGWARIEPGARGSVASFCTRDQTGLGTRLQPPLPRGLGRAVRWRFA